MKPLLIGLHGLARTGKDTAASYLVTQFALYSYAFADPIKAAIFHLFNLTQEHIEGNLKEVLLPGIGKSPRQLMQLLGTEWGREQVHPELWLLLAAQNIAYQQEVDQNHYNGVVIRDVRFENEADWIRRQGGRVVHILRPNAQAVSAHSSESGIAIHDNDFVIHNEGTIEDFQQQLGRMMAILRILSVHDTRPAA